MNFGVLLVCLLALVAGGCAQRGDKYEYTPPWKKQQQAETEPVVTAPVPQLSPRDQKLADLLRDYREGKITAQKYQEERAKVLSEK